MPENLLTLLNYLLLILLYLFFARVLWTVWSEVRSARPEGGRGRGAAPAGPAAAVAARGAAGGPAANAPATPKTKAKPKSDRRRKAGKAGAVGPATKLVVVQPPEMAGASFPLGEELTVGRAAGCQVSLPNDSYASSLHARAYQADGLTFVEDLGSTNGTFVNGERIAAPTALKVGDQLQIGSTVLEVA